MNEPPQRFRYAEWKDEALDGPAPKYWNGTEREWRRIRALRRYLAAKLAWREHMKAA